MLIALVSKFTLLEWLSKFAQCWVPRESVLWGSGAHKATSTAQNLKVTLIEWHLKLTLLALHQVFTPSEVGILNANLKYHLMYTYILYLKNFCYSRSPCSSDALIACGKGKNEMNYWLSFSTRNWKSCDLIQVYH